MTAFCITIVFGLILFKGQPADLIHFFPIHLYHPVNHDDKKHQKDQQSNNWKNLYVGYVFERIGYDFNRAN